jgi:uracil-DNA glycosylase
MIRIFINYRRQDSEGYVGRLYDHLLRHFDADRIFMDVDNIAPGADFVQVLEEAVSNCDVLLAAIGPQWLTVTDNADNRRLDNDHDFVRIEIASALRMNKLVIPVLVGASRMPSAAELPDDLRPLARRHAVSLSHKGFAYDVDKLAETIKSAKSALGKTRPDSETLRRKEAALKQVRDDLVRASESPLYPFRIENRYFPVVGEGNPDASIIFIGESPGKTEATTGKVFVGPSGDVLDEMLAAIGLKRADVYLTNVLLDHPGKRDPSPEEISFYAPFVDRLIDIIQPAVIATLGRFAMEYMFKRLNLPEQRGKISVQHGKLVKAQLPYGEIHVVPLYHPASVLYTPGQKDLLRQDFEKLKLFI